MINWKECGSCYLSIFLLELKEVTKLPSQGSQSVVRNQTMGHTEYEAVVVPSY